MKNICLIAGLLALLIALTNFSSTIMIEIFGSPFAIVIVKKFIVFGLIFLIFFMVVTGVNGFFIKNFHIEKIENINSIRMIIIALNGIFILVPSALYLNYLVNIKLYGINFIIVQTLEIIAGALNIFLMFKKTRTIVRIINYKIDKFLFVKFI